MRIPRIYTDQPLTVAQEATLLPAAAHYIANVLRMKSGRQVTLFNGCGGEYQGTLDQVGKKSVSVLITAFSDKNLESPLTIELGVCLIKNDRMDWLIQKATELGVSSIAPLLSEHTDIKLSEDRHPKKIKHWQQIAENACQQSGRTVVPKILSPQPLAAWLGQVEADYKCMLHPYDAQSLQAADHPKSIALLVGPEGGLEDSEVALAQQHHFSAVSLGLVF